MNEEFENFIALRVNDSFNLLGVWAMPKYVEMIHDYFDANTDLFDENLIMCGDFNSNTVFNNHHPKMKNHTELNKKLESRNLFSVYHNMTGDEQGLEKSMTFYQARHLNNPFHLDFVYAGENVVKEFKILDFYKWVVLSDHLPIAFEIDLNQEDMKFISKNGRKYMIYKTIKGERTHFGSFESLEEAIKERDFLVENNWGFPEGEEIGVPRKLGKYGRYIAAKDEYFTVHKYINGKYHDFGLLTSVDDAIRLRDVLIENDWDINKVPKELLITYNRNASDKRLYYIKHYGGKYIVSRMFDGDMRIFGTFDTKEEAIAERDYLIAVNWQVEDETPEEEKIDEYIYLIGDEYIVKNEINGEEKIFATFDEMAEAIRFRNLCVKTNWKP